MKHEFSTLYNDDRQGRCASKDCRLRHICANHAEGMSAKDVNRYCPVIHGQIDRDGIIYLSCEAYHP